MPAREFLKMNKKKKARWGTRKIILFLGIIFGYLFQTGSVLALEITNYPDMLGQSLGPDPSLSQYVCYLFGLGSALAFSIALIVIAYGGINYLISYGRGKFTSEGKEWLKAGVSGLLLVACAYLIAYTINPDLTSCRVAFLPEINLSIPNEPGTSTTPSLISFKEIPIGTLTETLLTRTMDCYGFNPEGNPIDGDKVKSDDGKYNDVGPTYLDHDREDCLLQLTDGAQKKSQIIATLSNEITKLMNQCDCELYGHCADSCGGSAGCQAIGSCPGGQCGGACSALANPPPWCKQPAAPPDCCPTGVKDKAEHGPIQVTVDLGGSGNGTGNTGSEASTNNGSASTCKSATLNFKGLDEFRCPLPSLKIQQCSGFAALIEKEVTVNKVKITVIDQTKWAQLNLIQQLTYFQEKIAVLENKIRVDNNELTRAKQQLATPQCYLALSSVDFLKKNEGADLTQQYVLNEKLYSDPETNLPVDVSRYCQGFGYDNSSCLTKCNNQCPDATNANMTAYAGCTGNNQESCIEKAYNARPCIYGKDTSQKYSGCVATCQSDCVDNCKKRYLDCSSEYALCQSQCNDNSKCVLQDNPDACLFGAQGFQQCASQITDPGNSQYCINNAYLCKNGSNEYAGYPDCVDESRFGCSAADYSASYLYDSFLNDSPGCEKCSYPYFAPARDSICYSSNNPTASCQDLCPETTKCLAGSNCADCPCDKIDQTLHFFVPDAAQWIKKNSGYNADDPKYTASDKKVSEYQMVGPQCNGYSYNDDPLTFYCEDDWWDNQDNGWLNVPNRSPFGEQWISPKEGEIPVGQAVQGAQDWAYALISSTDKIKTDIQKMLTNMDKAGKAIGTNGGYPSTVVQDYCKCNAKLETNKPICKPGCAYHQYYVPPTIDANGNYVPGHWVCFCTFVPCNGSPCDQIVTYLGQIWDGSRQLKIDFDNLYTYILSDPRSDVMKELTYSRTTMNNCSQKVIGSETKYMLLGCTRVKNEIISPSNSGEVIFNDQAVNIGCYGQDLGMLFSQPLMDDWFCCEQKPASTINR